MLSRLASAAARVLLLGCCLFGATASAATAIRYQALDLTDTGAGDLWRYVYAVTGNFNESEAFSIRFDAALYSDLQDPAPAVAGWDILVLAPDTGIPSAGVYEPMALATTSIANQVFMIDFVWIGGGTPGSQPFDVISYASGATVLEQGTTINAAATPEPSSWMLILGGGAAIALARRRSR